MTDLATIDNDFEEVEVCLRGQNNPKVVTLIPHQQIRRRRRNQTAFCFHDWCYKILIRNTKGCTETLIYKFVRALDIDISLYGNAFANGDQLDPRGRLQALASHLNPQPFSSMIKLPAEVRCFIWEYAGLATAYSSAILVAGESARLIRALNGPRNRDIFLEKASLSVKMVSIFGRRYIQDLCTNSEGNYAIPGTVAGLNFAIHHGGLCAIKVFGKDWDSGWLGQLPQTSSVWYGTILGTLSSIHCVDNVSQLTALSFSS